MVSVGRWARCTPLLLLCASVAEASVASPPPPSPVASPRDGYRDDGGGDERRASFGSPRDLFEGSSKASRRPTADVVEEADDEDFKRSEDWWRDPLAHFDRVDADAGESHVGSSDAFDDGGDKRTLPPAVAETFTTNGFGGEDGEEAIREDVSFRLMPVRTMTDLSGDSEMPNHSEDAGSNPEERPGSSAGLTPTTPSKSTQNFFKRLPISFQTRQQTLPRRMRGDDAPVAVQEGSSAASSGIPVPLLLATLVPHPVRAVLVRVPAIHFFALLALGKQLWLWRAALAASEGRQPTPRGSGGRFGRGKRPAARAARSSAGKTKPSWTTSGDLDGVSSDRDSSRADNDNCVSDGLDDAELEAVPEAFRNNPRTRALFQKKRPSPLAASEVPSGAGEKGTVVVTSKGGKQNPKNSNTAKLMPVLSGGWTEGLFGPRRPSARQLMDQVLKLEQSYQQAEQAKANLELAYEKANWQLQESQQEFDKLKQTTKYLQAQLRDNEEMLDQVVKQEQRKAKEDIMQMKEAMLKVVEREREAMRDEFIKQAAELERAWKQSIRHGRRSSRTRNGTYSTTTLDSDR